ncbi:hypothetical protein KCU92_g284, partial [Aureobasidium melanogenum]
MTRPLKSLKRKHIEWHRQGSNPEACSYITRCKESHIRTKRKSSSKEQKLIHRKLLPWLSVYGFGPHLTRGA